LTIALTIAWSSADTSMRTVASVSGAMTAPNQGDPDRVAP
jgi:hypothetical protein